METHWIMPNVNALNSISSKKRKLISANRNVFIYLFNQYFRFKQTYITARAVLRACVAPVAGFV